MGVILRRFVFGCFWFAVFWVGLSAIGGGVAGSIAGSKATAPGAGFKQGYSQGYDAGLVAGVEFRQRYGHYVVIAAAMLAAAGTFAGVLPGTRRK